jgi:hypothetical protein
LSLFPSLRDGGVGGMNPDGHAAVPGRASDSVFLGNLLSSQEPAVAGLSWGGGVLNDRGVIAPHQVGQEEQECVVPHKPLWTLWSEPRLDTLLHPGAASSRRTLCIADGMAYFASGLNGDALCRVEMKESDADVDDDDAGKDEEDEEVASWGESAFVEKIQTFPLGQPIRVIDLNASLLAACSDSFLVVFDRATMQRLALVEASSFPSAHVVHLEHRDCRIVDVCLPPDRFGLRSKREVLVLLSCGALLAVNFVENRITHLHSLPCETKKNEVIAARYVEHSRQFVVLMQKQLVLLDVTLPWDQCFRIVCSREKVKPSFHALAVSVKHAYLVAVATTEETQLWDMRFDRPLLRRLVPSTHPLESLWFEEDCIVGASSNGLLVLHQLLFADTALFWKGSMAIAKSIVFVLNSPDVAICGVALLNYKRLFVSTSVGHVFEQGFDGETNAPPHVLGRLVTLLVGNHNVEPEVVELEWEAQENDLELEIMPEESWLERDELPQVTRADILDGLEKRWNHNADWRKKQQK